MKHRVAPPGRSEGPPRAGEPGRNGEPASPGWSRLALTNGAVVQPKLRLGAVDDPAEREANRMAEAVVRGGGGVVQRCACEEEEKIQRVPGELPEESEEEKLQTKRSAGDHEAGTKKGGHGGPPLRASTESRISSLRGGGEPLSPAQRAYFEPHFGDLSAVRLHTGPGAQAAAREVSARAFTVGRDIAFGNGEYRPDSTEGRRLLAHELTHTVQQGVTRPGPSGSPIERALSPETIAGDWIIDNPTRKFPAGGTEDGDLIEGAFQQISSLAFRSGNRIRLGPGPPNTSQMEGHSCLLDIENDLASANPVLTGTPRVALEPHGWSFTSTSTPLVSARHPASPFEWGYWTGGQTRHVKPFWQTMAHEVCGHMAAHVRTRGTNVGSRGGFPGHNIAIEGENRIAQEHGVVPSKQRGLDFDPVTQRPMAGHRGESFLQSSIGNFGHAAANLPTAATAVVREVVDTVKTVSSGSSSGLNLFVQVEGFAFANEGGLPMGQRRAAAVQAQISTALAAAGISATIGSGATATPRFAPSLASVAPGSSTAGVNNQARRVHVYLFHQPHSAGP